MKPRTWLSFPRKMHSRRHRVLYELVAREIDASFVEAQKRLGLRRSASGAARLAYPYAKDTNTAAGALRLASPRTSPTFSTGDASGWKGPWNQGWAVEGLHYMAGCGC